MTRPEKSKFSLPDKEAVIVNNNGNELYGLIPKQMPGYNEIILEVEGKKYTSDNVKFKYYQISICENNIGKIW